MGGRKEKNIADRRKLIFSFCLRYARDQEHACACVNSVLIYFLIVEIKENAQKKKEEKNQSDEMFIRLKFIKFMREKYVFIYTHTHTCARVYIHTYIHIYIQKHTNTCTHIYIRAYRIYSCIDQILKTNL